MRTRRIILGTAFVAALLPAAAIAAPPVGAPPVPMPLVQSYALHGALTRYVPARFGDGSITIRVDAASANAAFAIGTTLTFRITPGTVVQLGSAVQSAKAPIGWIRVVAGAGIRSTTTLVANPAASVLVDRLDVVPVSRI